VPTIEALRNMCRAAGFSEVRTIVGPPPPPPPPPPGRRLRLARRIGRLPPPPPPSAPSENYRAIVHAYV
jgi:hypothetical protein